jgi:hypothetical protein
MNGLCQLQHFVIRVIPGPAESDKHAGEDGLHYSATNSADSRLSVMSRSTGRPLGGSESDLKRTG